MSINNVTMFLKKTKKHEIVGYYFLLYVILPPAVFIPDYDQFFLQKAEGNKLKILSDY